MRAGQGSCKCPIAPVTVPCYSFVIDSLDSGGLANESMGVLCPSREMGMQQGDCEYYRKRAAIKRERALRSDRGDVPAIHEELARQYQALLNQAALHPTLRIVPGDRQAA